jgi:tripartite-type tricarboxylate transporter receptor subunit TctC
MMRATYLITIAAVAATLVVSPASAETYPSRPVTIIVPFAAGGPVDTTTRIVADKMKDYFGQPIIVENLGGAAGSLAAAKVAKAAPDGYTIMTGIWGTHVANGAIYKLSYDVQTDFAPIALISSNPLLIDGSKKVPASDLKGLIAWLKANPGKATQGTSGFGSVGQIGGVFFQKMTGTKYTFAPYRGLAPAMQDLMAGTIDMMFDTPATSLPQVKAGNIRAFAVTSKQRISSAPEIPTVDEAGLPGLYVSTWTAFFAPKGTDKAIIAKLESAALKALADPALKERLANVGQDLYPPDQRDAAYLTKFQDEEIKKWWPIIKEAGIKGEQ